MTTTVAGGEAPVWQSLPPQTKRKATTDQPRAFVCVANAASGTTATAWHTARNSCKSLAESLFKTPTSSSKRRPRCRQQDVVKVENNDSHSVYTVRKCQALVRVKVWMP